MVNRNKFVTASVHVLAVALAAGTFQCFDKPADPVMPRWDVDLTAPLANQTYTLAEIAEKDPDLLQVVPGTTQLMLKTSAQAPPTFVGDRISLDPINSSFTSALGPFAIRSHPFELSVNIPGFTPGRTMVVPPVPPMSVPAVSGDVPFIDYAMLQSGWVIMRIQNRMPVAIMIEDPITIVNEAGGTIGVLDFGTAPIGAGGERSAGTDLGGILVRQRIRVQGMRISSPGSGTSMVTIPDPMLIVSMSAENLVATSANVSNIDSQHIGTACTIPLETGTLAKDVWINRGTLNFHVVSTVNLPSTVRFRVAELLTQSGQPFERTISLAARDSQDLAIDLARFHLHDPGNEYVRSLTANVSADVEGTAGNFVSVNSTDYVSARVATSIVIADSAFAILRPTAIAVDQMVGLNLGDLTSRFRGALTIPGAALRFTPRTSLTLPMELNLRVESRDRDGGVVILQVPVTKGNLGLSVIDFSPGDVGNFLSQVSGNLPDSLRIVGMVVLNPDHDTTMPVTIGRHGYFGGDVDLTLPLTLRIADGWFADTLVMGDTTGDGSADYLIDQETMKDVNYGKVHLEIDNGLPMGVKMKLVLLDNARNPLLTIPQGVGDSVEIGAGIVANGDVQTSAHSTRIIALNNTEVSRFNSATYVHMSMGVATPGNGAVNFRTTDKVRVRVWSEFSYRVNP